MGVVEVMGLMEVVQVMEKARRGDYVDPSGRREVFRRSIYHRPTTQSRHISDHKVLKN